MSKQAFVDLVTTDQPDAPAYFTYDAVLNSRERPTLEQALARELEPLTIDQVTAAVRDGAQLLDTRDAVEFAAAHLPGSVNIGLGGQYATWAGTLLDPSRPIVIVANPGAEAQSAMRLGRIGFDLVAGFLEGGLGALDRGPTGSAPLGSSLQVHATDRLRPQTAAERMAGDKPPLVIDVRQPHYGAAKAIDNTTSVPLSALAARARVIPRERPVVVFCAGGYPTSIAASLPRRHRVPYLNQPCSGLRSP